MPRRYTHITIGAIYIPPKDGVRAMLVHIHNNMDHIMRNILIQGYSLRGDMNQLSDSELICYMLKQIVTRVTRKDRILDKILTNTHKLYSEPTVSSPMGLSDYRVVLCRPDPQLPNTPQHKEYRQILVRDHN